MNLCERGAINILKEGKQTVFVSGNGVMFHTEDAGIYMGMNVTHVTIEGFHLIHVSKWKLKILRWITTDWTSWLRRRWYRLWNRNEEVDEYE